MACSHQTRFQERPEAETTLLRMDSVPSSLSELSGSGGNHAFSSTDWSSLLIYYYIYMIIVLPMMKAYG